MPLPALDVSYLRALWVCACVHACGKGISAKTSPITAAVEMRPEVAEYSLGGMNAGPSRATSSANAIHRVWLCYHFRFTLLCSITSLHFTCRHVQHLSVYSELRAISLSNTGSCY